MRQNVLKKVVVVCLALVAHEAFAAGEVNGRVRGVITEADTGLPVPGATVSARGSKLIGGPQVVQSAEDGTYLLVELPPGSYDIEITYAGVKPVKRKVLVRQGETFPLDIAWSAEMAEAEVTEVVEQRRLTRPDSTHTGTVLSFDTEKKIATQRTYTDVVQQVAGIKADRGLPVVKGATRLSNRYIVDGMDITDSVTNNFATQLNFDSIGSLEILTGGMEAQYNAMGGVINVNTNAGSDEFKLDTSFYFNHNALSAQDTYGSTLYDHELVFAKSKLAPNESYNITANISGPLIKQKLWYGLSFEYAYQRSSLQPAPPINLQQASREFHRFFPRLKLTWAPSSKHRVTWSTSGDPAIDANRNQNNNTLATAQQSQTQGGMFTVLQWDYFRSQYVSTNVQAGFNYNTVHQIPSGQFLGGAFLRASPRDPRFTDKAYEYSADAARHTNTVDGTSWYQGTSINRDLRYTVQFDPSISLRGKAAGEHDAKIGIQSRFVYKHFKQHTPGGAIYRDGNGAPLEAGLCDPETGQGCLNSQVTYLPDFQTKTWGFGIGAFVQDRWKVWKRLTLLPGIRFDYGITKNTVGETASSLFGIGPRIGAALDITGDQKTILTAFYGRSNETLSLLPAAFGDPSSTSETQRWDPTANNGQGGYTPLNTAGGPGGYKLNPNAATPHTDEVTVNMNREIFNDSIISLGYTYKRISNIWSDVEVNQIWDPTGQRVVGYVDGVARPVSLYTTPDQAYRIYHGVDLAVESRPTKNIDLYAGYTLSWNFGPGSDTINGTVGGGNAFANPRQTRYFDGYLPEDARHNVKLHASYTIHGFSLGTNINYVSGSPLTRIYYNAQTNSYSNRRSPSGTNPGTKVNDITGFSSFRTPDQLQVSLRASYDLHELTKQHLIFIADVFNLFNLDTPTSVDATDRATFGQANQGRISPLRVQLAIRYML
jgi:TonB dependent receptor/Carboxypeptidase regulatory-like domain